MNFISRYIHYLRSHSLRIAGMVSASLVFVAFSGISYWLAADFIQALFSGEVVVPPLPAGKIGLHNVAEVLKHYSATLVVAGDIISTLKRAIVILVAAFLVKNVALYIQTVLAASIEQRVAKAMRDQLYGKLLDQDLGFFHLRQSGDLVSIGVNDITTLNAGVGNSFSKLIRDPIMVAMFLLLLFSISWQMTLAALLIAPLSGIMIGFAGTSLKRKAKRTQDRIGTVVARLNDALYGMRIVQAYGAQERESDAFKQATDAHFRQALGRERLRRLIPPLNEIIGVVVIAAILLVAGGKVLGGAWLDSEDFVRFLLLMFGLLTPVVSLGEVQAHLKVAEGASQRVFALMDADYEIDETDDPIPVRGLESEIRFEDVTLEYQRDRNAAIREINLRIRPREKIVIIGRSGSGKSTLLNLLPRFYDPTSGRITFDGRDLRELGLADLRSMFGIVAQEVVLFHDTVRNNIAYGKPETPLEQVVRAAKTAHAHEFIVELPEGYDTNLGDLGDRLSGGQRQRISIARAVLNNPPVLLLDEPTSALDSDVAAEIQKTLDEVGEGRTVVMATHRVSSVNASDRILLIDDGRLIAEGCHEELYSQQPLYRDLWDRQVMA